MSKYIDAEVLKNNIHKCNWVHDSKSVEKFVDKLPAADVQEVRHGRWELYDICSVCGAQAEQQTNYCPNCGAKMDEVDK